MLDFFRRQHSRLKWIWVVLIFVFSAGLILLYIPIGERQNIRIFSGEVARVGTESVTAEEFQEAYSTYVGSIAADLSPEMLAAFQYDRQLVEAMINQRIPIAEARRMGLDVSPGEIRQIILSNPAFLENGQFIGINRYENLLFQNNLTVQQFESEIRNQLLTEKLFSLLTSGVTVTDQEIIDDYRYQNEKVILDYVLVDPIDLESEVTLSDEEEREYFDKNQALYTIPEKRRARYVRVDTLALRSEVEVTEAEIEQYYTDNRSLYEQEPRVRAQHILFRTDGKTEEEIAQIRERAADVLERVRAGEDFGELAREFSEDTTAETGGDLGDFGPGQMVPEFEQAAFSLGVGATSDLVQTQFGIHIIRVNERREARVQPLDEVGPSIEILIRAQKAGELGASTAQAIAVALASDPNLDEVAAEYGSEVGETPLFARADGLTDLGDSVGLVDQIFSLDVDEIGTAEQVQNGWVVPQLAEIDPTHPATLEEVRDQVRGAAITEKAQALAQERGLELERLLEDAGQSLESAARALGLEVMTSEPLARDGALTGFGATASLDDQIFTLEPGVPGSPVTVGTRTIAFQVEERLGVDEEALETDFEALRSDLLTRRRDMIFQAYSTEARERMQRDGEIRINTAMLADIVEHSAQFR